MKSIFTFLFMLLVSFLQAVTYHVSPTGSDTDDGLSTSTSFKTIQHAADLTIPGDTVYVMNGTYSNEFTWQDLVKISRSGTIGNPIVYTNYPGHNPKIEFNGWHAFKIEDTGSAGVSYIEISGFEIEGNNANINLADALNQPAGCNDLAGNPDGFYNGNGIASDGRYQGKNHHITIRNCKVYNCAGAGISAIHTDYVTIENCEVYNNAWYSIYGNSGITLYQLYNFDNNNSGYRNVIRNCKVYSNRMDVPWIAFCNTITDGNGIIIDDSRNTQNGSTNGTYTGKTLIENNIVYENGGRGIHIFESDNVDVLNNTTYANGQSVEIDDGEITAVYASNVKVYNNIIYAKTGERLNKIQFASNVIFDYNLNYNSTQFDQTGANSLSNTNPNFTNLNNRDFSLGAGSPAIDTGSETAGCFSSYDIDGVNRPIGSAPDIGAYESSLVLPVEYLQPLWGEVIKEGVLLEWTTATEVNASHFVLEHTTDLPDFKEIGEKTAIGSNRYSLLHRNAITGLNYYRLQQVDKDGKSHTSNIISVEYRPLVTIFPNPTEGQIQIDSKIPISQILVYDVSGKCLMRSTLESSTLDLSQLQRGIYLLTVIDKWGNRIAEEKITVF